MMTEEEKQLLLKDLCARLPYKVMVGDDLGRIYELHIGNAYLIDLFCENGDYVEPPIKPYLRPLSSITDIEQKKYRMYICEIESSGFNILKMSEMIDWLNSIYVDYNGLIPMGLALPAPKDMYNFKK